MNDGDKTHPGETSLLWIPQLRKSRVLEIKAASVVSMSVKILCYCLKQMTKSLNRILTLFYGSFGEFTELHLLSLGGLVGKLQEDH